MLKCIYIFVGSIFDRLLILYRFVSYKRQWIHFARLNSYKLTKTPGEDEYIARWKKLSRLVSKTDFRFMCNYCDAQNVVPENVVHSQIEKILNPDKYAEYYSDKSIMPLLLHGMTLQTLACRVNGSCILDKDFKPFKGELAEIIEDDAVFLKPSLDTDSGIGVAKFKRIGNDLINSKGEKLTNSYLLNFSNNFVVQAAFRQCKEMSLFNVTSVNTIRLYTYRSVLDEQPHIVAGVLRIGGKGSEVDNAHAGGRFVGINVENGRLGETTYHYKGTRQNVFNGIDFENEEIYLPAWNEVKEFALRVSEKILHMRYLALDIAIDEQQHPFLVEFNCKSSSPWLCMYTNQNPFGSFTDEIINYCVDFDKYKN